MKLILENVEKSFQNKQVLKKINFEFEKGKIYGLLGRNGAGKTTLFNCISGELKLDNGCVRIQEDDASVGVLNYSRVGFVFADPVLPEFLTGYEFLKFFIDVNKDKIKELKSIEEYFNIIKIDKYDRFRLIKEYSHGMKNKLQMLCFLIIKPPVILLDEPLTSFDVIVALEIKSILKEIKRDHIIIFSTHILQLAKDLCDDIVVINNGKLENIPSEVLHSEDLEKNIIDILREE